MATDELIVHGAREHNLKDIDVRLPRNALVCITGLSGSGKSSLAFDTIYAEGQRRYVESLSAYARQFLQMMEKPDVDSIEGLSPAISIDQKTTSRNPRSTVGTVTEIYDYLRLLYARVGRPHCPVCGRPIAGQSLDQIVEQILALPEGTRFTVNAPVVRDRKGEFRDVLEELRADGFTRVKVDGEQRLLEEEIVLDKKFKHSIEVVVDRLVQKPDLRQRLTQSVETAAALADGLVAVDVIDGDSMLFSEKFACPEHGVSLPELQPRIFSFNSPHGACPRCTGLGSQLEIDPDLIVPDTSVTIGDGALVPWTVGNGGFYESVIQAICDRYEIDPDTPWRELTTEQQDLFLHGTGGDRIYVQYRNRMGRQRSYTMAFEGIVSALERRYQRDRLGSAARADRGVHELPAGATCKGARLKPEVLAVTVGDEVDQRVHPDVRDARARVPRRARAHADRGADRAPDREGDPRAADVPRRRRRRLPELDRAAKPSPVARRSGSARDADRLQLVGVLYILDEPSIGLHQRDNDKLIGTLQRLALGNTVLVVEHDEQMMRRPTGSSTSARAQASTAVMSSRKGTADRRDAHRGLDDRRSSSRASGRIADPARREDDRGEFTVRGASIHNLKGIDVEFPLGFVCVTGVSGSGKSTLVNEILFMALANRFKKMRLKPGATTTLKGIEEFDKVIEIDQKPIGRTPRSNPATYTDVFTQSASSTRKPPKRRCAATSPAGSRSTCAAAAASPARATAVKIEMHFLPNVYVHCEVCHGTRYNEETLEVSSKGKSIADVLDMPSRRRSTSSSSRSSAAGCRPCTTSASATSSSGNPRRRSRVAKRNG